MSGRIGPLVAGLSLLVSLVLVGVLTSDSHAAQAGCGAPSARTLAATKQMRLYESPSASSEGTVYACLTASGRRQRLGPIHSGGEVWSASVRGPFVLTAPWAGATESRVEGQDTVRVFSVARSVASGQGRSCLLGDANRPGQLPDVKRALLDDHGTLVWVAILRTETPGPEIGACEPNGPVILDSGEGISISSVTLRGTRVSWTHSGVDHSADVH